MYLAKGLSFFSLDPSTTLLINSKSGAIDKIPSLLASRLKRIHERDTSEVDFELESGVEEHLRRRGYLFDTLEDEKNYVQELYEKSKKVSAQNPVKFVICPTYSCSLRCVYCYEGDLVSKKKAIMSETQLSAVFSAIDEIKSSRSMSTWLFELFGGEPLLKATESIVEMVFQEIQDREDALAIVTSGTSILEFQEMIHRYRSVLDSVQITLDGPKAVHDARRKYASGKGTFDKIVRGVDFLLEEGVHVRLRVNVDKENIDYLPDLVAFIERKNWPFYQNFLCDVAPVTFHTSFVDSKNVLTEDQAVRRILEMFPDMSQLKKVFNFEMFRTLNYVSSVLEPTRQHVSVLPSFYYCEANNLECYVFGPDNHIYACPDSIVDSRYAIGTYYPNLHIDTKKHSYWERNILNIPECRDCEVATFCGGGCALVPLESGKKGPACNGARETFYEYLGARKEKLLNNNQFQVIL